MTNIASLLLGTVLSVQPAGGVSFYVVRATVLAPTSNMVRFQAEVYLVPSWLDKEELLHAAFHRGLPADLREAPRDTGLRRALVETLEAGREIEAAAGGCFLRPEDLRWGEQVYRRQVLPFPR